jgi:predicted transcriptional regulator
LTIRFERGETQVQIAKYLGITRQAVIYYLRLAGVPGAVHSRRPMREGYDSGRFPY